MATRPLTFPPKTTTQRKHRDIAVAWITKQHGGFQTANVTATIHKALRDAGFRTTQEHVMRSMIALEGDGYAIREVIGRRHVLFMMDADVDVPEPGFVAAQRMRTASLADPVPAAPLPADPGPSRRPPLPRRTPDMPGVFAELSQAVLDWWRDEPDAATAWATDALASLR